MDLLTRNLWIIKRTTHFNVDLKHQKTDSILLFDIILENIIYFHIMNTFFISYQAIRINLIIHKILKVFISGISKRLKSLFFMQKAKELKIVAHLPFSRI